MLSACLVSGCRYISKNLNRSTYWKKSCNLTKALSGFTDRLICELLYATGMRRNELQQLKEKDIEWSLNQIRILGKGNKERLVPLSAVLLDTLREYIEEKHKLEKYNDVYLLNSEKGKPTLCSLHLPGSNKVYWRNNHPAKEKPARAGKSILLQTHLLNNGANIQAIKDLLGHSSLAATQVYTHNNIDKLKEIHRQNHPRG